MKLSAREEIVIELFRDFDPEQRTELIKWMRSLVDANRVSKDKMNGRPLRIVRNVRIESKYGLPHPTKNNGVKKSGPQSRRPDRAQDDSAGAE
jgi:hypothetical protein